MEHGTNEGYTKTIRFESDSIGTLEIPENSYYGVQTIRAKENFSITGRPLHPLFISNLAKIKKAAAIANQMAGELDEKCSKAISEACDDIVAGKFYDAFIVDAIQGGAG